VQLEKVLLLDISRFLITGIASVLLAQSSDARGQADIVPRDATAPANNKATAVDRSWPWFIILNSPDDLAAFWQSIEHPDLVVIKPDQLNLKDGLTRNAEKRTGVPRWVVESVEIRGQVAEEHVNLKVELSVVVKGVEPIWVPVRLDRQSLVGAHEGSLELSLRRVDPAEWQVKLQGERVHHVVIELRALLKVTPARKSLSLAIPEAASTSIDMIFSRGESDVIVGDNEVFIQPEVSTSTATRARAHVPPRGRLDMSWTTQADNASRNPPLLTAKSEIAIDIDDEQVRTRTSWAIRCVRGTARSLELRVDDDDDITEIQLDDQPAEGSIERVRGSGKLKIRLADPLRTGVVKRLVMKTRRAFARPGIRRISFVGYPLVDASEQSGFIGVTQSANLFVNAPTLQGLRPVNTDKLPENLRTRPSTSLAYEFLDQPFLLDLVVESSPPLVRARSKTLFRIEGQRARSETEIEFDWVRGELSELELGVAAGLRLISVGPAEIVESSHLADDRSLSTSAGSTGIDRRLRIRLKALGRDPSKVTVVLGGHQTIPEEGSVKLGLFTPMQAASVSASYALIADRSISVAVEDDTGRIRRLSEPATEPPAPRSGWPWTSLRGEQTPRPILVADDGLLPFLPIRIARHSRAIHQGTVLSAQVSRRSVDVLERTSFTVRFGAVSSLEMHVPASIADRWDLLDKEVVDREELGREPDGSRRYRLSFSRPVVDKAMVRVRYRLPLVPALDARSVQVISLPWVTYKEMQPGLSKVELSISPDVVVKEFDPAWHHSSDEGRAESAGESGLLSFEKSDAGSNERSFSFKAIALEPVPLPPFVVPRLLLKTVSGGDDTVTTSARYWVESPGLDFSFALPEGSRWIGARVDGRPIEHVDHDPSRGSYRLRLLTEAGSRPVLVELDYQLNEQGARSRWAAPRLLDGGAVLQTLWEVRLPSSSVLLGVPRGWSDENQWYWSGLLWKRRPWQSVAGTNDWLLGAASASGRPSDDFDRFNLDYSDRYLFSRTGRPVALSVWVVQRAWLVGICSGAALLVGFLAIFSRLSFRTVWLTVAGLGLLAAVLVEVSVTVVLFESAVVGVILTLSGLLIESLIVRSRSRSVSPLGAPLPNTRPGADSSLQRSPTVGSDDSTAIRVRVPSTMDFVTAPVAAREGSDPPRPSHWEHP
jgi:hypothetical protein